MPSTTKNTTGHSHEQTEVPHLKLEISQTPLLSTTTPLPLLIGEDDPFFSLLGASLRAPCFSLEHQNPTLRSQPSASTLVALSSTSGSSDTLVSQNFSSRALSLFSASQSTSTLSDKPLPSLPSISGIIPTKEIISLLRLLNQFDEDVSQEVLRVKSLIRNARDFVGEYNMEIKLRMKNVAAD